MAQSFGAFRVDVQFKQVKKESASGVNHNYQNIKWRLFLHGGLARRRHRPGYVTFARLALRKNPSVLSCSTLYDSRH